MDDGFMEVVGLFGAAQMAALQVGDTGSKIVVVHSPYNMFRSC